MIIKIIFGIIILLMLLVTGWLACIEPKEAQPAVVNESVLKEEGWVSAGDVQKKAMIMFSTDPFVGYWVKESTPDDWRSNINISLMSYRHDLLAQNIMEQVRKLSGITSKQASGVSQFTSQLIIMRLLVSGPKPLVDYLVSDKWNSIPYEIMNTIIDSQLEQMGAQNNIRNFHETGSYKTTIANGKEVSVKNYEGFIDFEGGSIKVRGITYAWPESDSNIVVFAVLPAEDIVITPSTGKPVYVKINGEQESQNILKLIQNVS